MSQTTFYSRNFVGWPPVHLSQFNNPNSAYWRERANAAANRFDGAAHEFMTKAEWEWLNDQVYACLGQTATWKAFYETYQKILDGLKTGVTVQAIAFAAGVLAEQPESEEKVLE